jgi:hypothetical protein
MEIQTHSQHGPLLQFNNQANRDNMPLGYKSLLNHITFYNQTLSLLLKNAHSHSNKNILNPNIVVERRCHEPHTREWPHVLRCANCRGCNIDYCRSVCRCGKWDPR